MNKAIIDRNRAELMQLLAYLFTYIGLADDVSDAERATDRRDRALRGMALPATISRRLHKTISQLLKPMEAAVRRLIVAMAALLPPVVLRPFEMKPRPTPKPDLPRTFDASAMVPACLAPSVGPPLPSHTRAYSPRFSLFDPLRFKTYVCDANEPAPSVDWSKFPADPMNEHKQVADHVLMRRIAALTFVLEDMPAQARRYAHWNARRALGLTRRKWPLKPGRPPGAPRLHMPQRELRQEHFVLRQAHDLATSALHAPDTS